MNTWQVTMCSRGYSERVSLAVGGRYGSGDEIMLFLIHTAEDVSSDTAVAFPNVIAWLEPWFTLVQHGLASS